MALLEGHKTNFNTLLDAFKAGRVALVECKDAKTGEPVAVLCAVNEEEDAQIGMVPFARMFNGDPYEELIDPFAAEVADREAAELEMVDAPRE